MYDKNTTKREGALKKLQTLSLVLAVGVITVGVIMSLPLYATVPGINAAIDINTSGGSPSSTNILSTYAADVSQDGRYVVFVSSATDLVSPSTSGQEVFLRDRLNNTTELISKSTSSIEGNGKSYEPKISEDGRYIVFSSQSTNLVSGDTNNKSDIFLRDRNLNTTVRVSFKKSGAETTTDSVQPDISADGKYVVWTMKESSYLGVYLVDTSTGVRSTLSINASGNSANADSRDPRISCEGRFVIFTSKANNLTSGDMSNATNNKSRVYLVDRLKPHDPQYIRGTAQNPNGGLDSRWPYISCNGNYITFTSDASGNTLITGDTNNKYDVFLYNRIDNTIQRVSTDSSGGQGNNDSAMSAVSNDGKYVVFDSDATNLIANDTNGQRDIFLKNTQTGTLEAISRDSNGNLVSSSVKFPTISTDGKYAVYQANYSPISDLVDGYTGNWFASRTGADYDY